MKSHFLWKNMQNQEQLLKIRLKPTARHYDINKLERKVKQHLSVKIALVVVDTDIKVPRVYPFLTYEIYHQVIKEK